MDFIGSSGTGRLGHVIATPYLMLVRQEAQPGATGDA
jgi:hypothetical protein